MTIKWVRSIREQACNRTAVRVLQSYPPLAGQIGLVCRHGHTGRDGSLEVYELEIKNPKGGTKKHVLASVYCRLHLPDQGQDQSRGGAAYQNAGSGGCNAQRYTRDGGDSVALSPSYNPKMGQAAAKVCWVLDAVCQNGHIILQAVTFQRRSKRHRDQDVDSDVAGRRVGG